MMFPIGVIAVYVALVVWLVLLVLGIRMRRYGWFIGFGIALMLVLNVRYLVEGAPAGIAFFIGIYDVLNNLGLAPDAQVAGMTGCVDGQCSVWGERFACTRPGAWPSTSDSLQTRRCGRCCCMDTCSSTRWSSC